MSEEISIAPPSLPDQLPIIAESSTHTGEELRRAPLFKVTKKKRSTTGKTSIVLQKPKRIIRRYFTSGVKVTEENARDFKKEVSPFEYPKDIELFAHNVMTKAWRKDKRIEELQEKVYSRPAHKGRQKRDLLNRLYVEKPVVTEGKTVLNMDPNYYSVVGGRQISDKLEIRDYIQTVRESLRTKIVIGFREDDIMLIDEAMKLEQQIIDTIKENLQNYINVFEEFLIKDHRTAMNFLQQAEATTTSAYTKYLENKEVATKFASLRSSLYNVEEKWKQCQTYQNFLYAVSPMTWRMQQESGTTKRTSIYMMEQKAEDPTSIYRAYRVSLAEKGLSLQDIVNEFKESSDGKPAQLYFTEPWQLLDVFKFIEMQNLNSLLHSEGLVVPLENVKEGMRIAVQLFDNQIKKLKETIESLEGGISWEEQRVIYLEQLAIKLIKTELKNIINDERLINLHVFVEDIYEATIGQNDANLSLWEMMKAIEETYRRELLLMDKIPSEQVALLEGNYYKEEMFVMKLAQRAARQHDELEKITVNLKKAYSPPVEMNFRKLKNRSPPIKHPLKEEEPPRYLTAEEKEFLDFFTDFCVCADVPEDYRTKKKSDDGASSQADD